MFVGGEFAYDGRWLGQERGLETEGAIFLNGGTACLVAIAAWLRGQGVGRVLLPTYLCPSILNTLEHCGLGWDFYEVNEDLSIDVEDAGRKAERARAFLYINYFGFRHGVEEREFLRSLRAGGVVVIEDHALGGLPLKEPVPTPLAALVRAPKGGGEADFSFNSLRKFGPYDGGYLWTDQAVGEILEQFAGQAVGERLGAIRAYRAGLGEYLRGGKGSHRGLASLLRRAERAYEREYTVMGDPQERAAIERLDWEGIRRVRRENYAYGMELLPSIPGVRAVFPKLQEGIMPLGLPVYLEEVTARGVLELLAREQVGLVTHWEEIPRDRRTRGNRRAVGMAERMITLAVDQRAGKREMEYQSLQLVRAMAVVRERGAVTARGRR